MNARDITLSWQTKNELKLAKEAAEAANKAKSAFLANMSHELRTPLNAVLGFAGLLKQNAGLTRDQIESIDIISKSGNHLLNLINDVLDMSKIEAGRTSLRETAFDLWLMLDDIEDMLRLRAKEKNLQLIFERTADFPRYIYADEAKLRQVLINLLNNALKFTQEGGVALRAGIWNKNYSNEILSGTNTIELSFEVEDTGSGISEDKLESIFEPFFQTHSGYQSEEGTGLGLSISKKFVQLMGGDINLYTKTDQGSMFKFYIKAGLAGPENIYNKKKSPKIIGLQQGQPKYRILIVDDRWDNRQLLVKLLKPLGFSICEAENGRQAVKLWKKWEPHLIWMDMRMPVMDGYEAVKQIKSNIKGQATAVIALTASAFEDERSVVMSAGCDDFLRKPFRQSDIFLLMQKHIGVKYEYEEQIKEKNKPSPDKNIISSLCFAKLDPELLISLEKAAIEGDMTAMDKLIEQIRLDDEQIAYGLAQLAQNFEYSKILLYIKNENPRVQTQ